MVRGGRGDREKNLRNICSTSVLNVISCSYYALGFPLLLLDKILKYSEDWFKLQFITQIYEEVPDGDILQTLS